MFKKLEILCDLNSFSITFLLVLALAWPLLPGLQGNFTKEKLICELTKFEVFIKAIA